MDHPILGEDSRRKTVTIMVDGKPYPAYEGSTIAASLLTGYASTAILSIGTSPAGSSAASGSALTA